MTLFPSFHISVINVSPGYTTPANLSIITVSGEVEVIRLIRYKREGRGAVLNCGYNRELDLPNFDILVRTESFKDVFSRNTHKAKSMQDRLVESTHSGELR